MRILLVAPQPYYTERGTPIAVRLLARTLVSLGHEVDLLTYPFGDDPEDVGVNVVRAARPPGITGVPIGFSPSKLLCDLPLSVALVRMHLRYRYDVIHAVEEAIYPALIAARVRQTAVVYDMDSSLVEQLSAHGRLGRLLGPVFTRLERLAIRRADRVVAVCDALVEQAERARGRNDVVALYDVPNIATEVEPVDSLRESTGSTLSDDVKIALYVGNLESYQGIDLLLDSLAPLAHRTDLTVVVVGGDAQAVARYEALARERGVDGRVRFLGPRPLEQLGALLAQSDILLSPRIRGGNTPMKLYSYMAAGKAILATRLSTHTQALGDDAALLTEPVPAAFSRDLERLLDDPDLRARLGAAAKRLVDEKYSLERFTETLSRAYAELR